MFYYMVFVFVWINSILCDLPDGSVLYYLYNTNYPDGIEIHNATLSGLEIDSSRPFKIWFHGVTTNSTINWDEANTEIYLERDYNLIGVDWYEYSYIYVTVIEQMDDVSKLIGDFFIKFCEELSVPYDSVHVIGHSLGAHLAGLVSRHVYSNTNEKFGRITALDPTDLLLNVLYSNKRLRRSDAIFVDAIHTSFLSVVSFAHADFYPNGGRVGNIASAENNSHMMVLVLYAESINSTAFIGRNCSTYTEYHRGSCLNNVQAVMGENCDTNTRGDFFLDINDKSPYGMDNNTKEGSTGGNGAESLFSNNIYYLSILVCGVQTYISNKLFQS